MLKFTYLKSRRKSCVSQLSGRSAKLFYELNSVTLACGWPVTRRTEDKWLDVVSILGILAYIPRLLTTLEYRAVATESLLRLRQGVSHNTNVSFADTWQSGKYVNTNGDLWGRISVEWSTRMLMYVPSEDMTRTWSSFLIQVRFDVNDRSLSHFVLSRAGGLASRQLQQSTIETRPVSGRSLQIPNNFQLKHFTTVMPHYNGHNAKVSIPQKPIDAYEIVLSSMADLRSYSMTVTSVTLTGELPFARATYCRWATRCS